MIFISPHFDDAVLSCGEWIAEQEGAIVVTVCGGAPRSYLVTDYDVKCGFKDSTDAVHRRYLEDYRAISVLGAYHDRWQFCDAQYGEQREPGNLEDMLHQQVFADTDQVVAPLGLAHRDHIRICDAVLTVAKSSDVPLVLYEELPRRVHEPQEVLERLELLYGDGWRFVRYERSRGDTDLKEAAVRCYRSQAWALDWRSALVPERYWRATWTG